MAGNVTMTDVAKAAGVHQTTVSLALREHGSIPVATRERIREIARQMGYRRNPLVSALISERRRKKQSRYGGTLAFLTAYDQKSAWRTSHNYTLVYKAMCQRADELGYHIEDFWYRDPQITPSRLKQILLARGIRGIIVCPLPYGIDSLEFDFSDFAAVSIGYTLKYPLLDRVSVDYYGIMQLAIRKLGEMGYKRIGFISAPSIDQRVNHLSMGAFLAEKQVVPGRLISPLIANYREWDSISNWIRKKKPDAIIASVSAEYEALSHCLEANQKSFQCQPLLCVVDAKIDGAGIGVVQNLEVEASATIELVTSRVERAQFGTHPLPQTILVGGNWRGREQGNPEPDEKRQIRRMMPRSR